MDFVSKSVKGKREKNEDSYALFGESFFVVADGLGGRVAGEVASKIAVDVAISSFKKGNEITKIYSDANMAIIDKVEKKPKYKGMGTTMVSCLLKEDEALIANVGDSRCYLFSDEGLKLVSKDDRGIVGNLTRALGVTESINVHTNIIKLKDKDIILLASDGLTDFVSDKKISKVLARIRGIDKKVDNLVNLAMKNESDDNVTVSIIAP